VVKNRLQVEVKKYFILQCDASQKWFAKISVVYIKGIFYIEGSNMIMIIWYGNNVSFMLFLTFLSWLSYPNEKCCCWWVNTSEKWFLVCKIWKNQQKIIIPQFLNLIPLSCYFSNPKNIWMGTFHLAKVSKDTFSLTKLHFWGSYWIFPRSEFFLQFNVFACLFQGLSF